MEMLQHGISHFAAFLVSIETGRHIIPSCMGNRAEYGIVHIDRFAALNRPYDHYKRHHTN